LLHELAHAIAHFRSPKAPPHGPFFREVCREIGAAPAKYVDVSTGRWGGRLRFAARCSGCDREVVRRRRVPAARCKCGELLKPRRWQVIALRDGGARTVIGSSAPPGRR
jgi:predicted SprT family Zn-dependent metalloprotease